MVSFPKISPNLLLGVGGIIAAVFLVSQVRKAGADVQDALSGLKLPSIPSLPSITIGGTTIGETIIKSTFPSIPQDDKSILEAIRLQGGLAGQTNQEIIDLLSGLTPLGTPENLATAPTTPTAIDVILNDQSLTQAQKDELLAILNPPEISDPGKFTPPVGAPQFTGKEEDRAAFEAGLIDQFGRPIEQVEPVTPIEQPFQQFQGTVTQEEILAAPAQLSFEEILAASRKRLDEIKSKLPDIENPIDTLSEVLKFFPELSASQAADFLASAGGEILPSQIELIDPDIRNIVAGFEGGGLESVSSTPLETLSIRESENIRAAKFTCEQFGLNCELAASMMA